MKKAFLFALVSALVLVLAACQPAASSSPGTIVEVAQSAGSFNTLVAAVQEAGLVDTLNSEGPFTVFAPTDDAFASLLSTMGINAEALLSKPELKDILLYHVVSGEVKSETVVTLSSATTVGGGDVSIEVVDGNVFLNGTVKVVTTDIVASNGVIHVIDGVLLP